MQEKYLVSVIIPVYNSSLYLQDILDDVKKQTYKKLEIIVIDDGSSDNSLEIARENERTDQRIQVYSFQNGGQSRARNIGLRIAKGQFIRFIDADDRVPADSIENMLSPVANSDSIDMVIGNFISNSPYGLYSGNELENTEISDRQFAQLLLKTPRAFYFGAPWNKLYRADIIRENHILFDEGIAWCEDLLFNLEYYQCCKKIHILNCKNGVYQYFVRDTGATGVIKNNKVEEARIEEISIRRYRRNLRILLAAGGMTVMLLGASGVSYAAADHMQRDEYAYNLEAGRRSPNKQDSIAFYQKAIQTDCAGEEAYDQLLTLFTQDGVLDEQEEKVLLQLSISVDKYLERYKMQNPDGYAGLCYRIGSSYWYYYEHEEKRQAGAVAWFESAKAGFAGNPEKEQEWKRASTYVEIGNFYQRIVPAQISGTDQGMYGEYWNNLRWLKEWNDEAPDRDLVTLRLYREIVTKTLEYAGYLQEDGVPPQEMEELLKEISQQTENMKTGAGQVLMEEIQELEQVLKGAQQMLASCKWKGGAS